MRKLFYLLIFLGISISIFAQDNSPFVRTPAVNNNGSLVAFSYQGDIWTVPAQGGDAKRLTIHQGYEGIPLFSPDGKKIAFQSNRWGNYDIFTMNLLGGDITRLTYHSTGDQISDWTNQNNILFETRRTFRQVEWDREIYSVSAEGGTPNRILDAFGYMAVESPDGKKIAFVRGACRVSREDYVGRANRDIWLYDVEEQTYTQLTDFEGNDYMPRWIDSESLYYISAASGLYNVHKLLLDGTSTQITNFKKNGVRHLDVSSDGSTIVLERETDIYVKKDNSDPVKLDIKLGADYRFDPIVKETKSGKVENFAVSPNGKLTAFVVRGEVFVKENDKDKSKSVNVSNHSFRDQNPTWLTDSTLVFVSDREGQKELYLAKSADPKQTNIFKSLKHEVVRLTNSEEDEDWPIVSPDGKKIVYEIGRGKLVVKKIDAEGSLSEEVVLLDGWSIPGDVSWSPDSRWVAYSLDDLDFNQEVYIQPVDGSKQPVNISMHPRLDGSPVWSRDGSKLAFVSNRNNRDNDVWFTWLNKEDWQKTKQDWEEDDEEKPEKKDKKKKKDDDDTEDKDSVEPIKIDLDRIHERLTQLTSMPGDEGNVSFTKDGETIYFSAGEPATKGRDLYSIKFDKSETKRITKGGKNPSSLFLDNEGKYQYLKTKGGKLARLKDGGKDLENLSFSAKLKIDYVTEIEQIFEESWRTLRDGFYDPNFHGKDWNELKAKYKPWILKSSTKTDFQYLTNIMLGEVNASHMGIYGSGREDTQKEATGYLGIEITPVDDGVKVEHVILDTPADKEISKLKTGDVIIAVDGEKISSDVNFYSLLNGKQKEKILLTVNSNGTEKEIVIRPTNSLRNALYNEWVNGRRKLVDEYSGGRLGYLHIQAMGWNSFERFERELTAVGQGKEGIVIDVRYNGGGWTTDFLMTVLNVRQHSYNVPRGATDNLEKNHKKYREHYAFGERLPYAWWTKPSIAICNANSYSNAEIFSHAYKTLGHGTLVGQPTFGAVISTSGKGLIDGSYVRLPFRAWYVKATDENMEWGPAVPDILIDNSPDHRAKGIDEQLKKSVDTLIEQIDSAK